MQKTTVPTNMGNTRKEAIGLLGKLDKIIAEKSAKRIKVASRPDDSAASDLNLSKDSCEPGRDLNRTAPAIQKHLKTIVNPQSLNRSINEKNAKPSKNSTSFKLTGKSQERSLQHNLKKAERMINRIHLLDISRGSNCTNRSHQSNPRKVSCIKEKAEISPRNSKSPVKKQEDLKQKAFYYLPKSKTPKRVESKQGKHIEKFFLNQSTDKHEESRSFQVKNNQKKDDSIAMPLKNKNVTPVPPKRTSEIPKKHSNLNFVKTLKPIRESRVPSKSPTARSQRDTGCKRIDLIPQLPSNRSKKTPLEKKSEAVTKDKERTMIAKVSTKYKLPSANSSLNQSDFIHLETLNQSEVEEETIGIDFGERYEKPAREVNEHHIIQQKINMLLEREKKIARTSQLTQAAKLIGDRSPKPAKDEKSKTWRGFNEEARKDR